ncbi:hypothetical protein BAC1_01681 [uncultured bacterium]|nr:hypothetical protein BAC1_01681 [uncultured bacterium]
MSKCIREVIEALKQRRDNLDAAIKILQDEAGDAEEQQEEKKSRGRPRKKACAFPGLPVSFF